MRVSDFQMKYSCLKGYTVNQISKVLDKLGISQDRKRINGENNPSRVRLLPTQFLKSNDFENI